MKETNNTPPTDRRTAPSVSEAEGHDDTVRHAKVSFITRMKDTFVSWYAYVTDGVWNDTRRNMWVNLVKTLNLSVRSFLNADLQMRAGSLTYQTLLAIVPALALVFAIGRGFGFQNLLQSQLFHHFPAQKEALSQAFRFVDSYLAQSSEGIFVGVGILFLLWTLISLVSSVENAFNLVWGIKQGRTLWRKLTDYTAIFLILPVLMICAGGIMVFMSTTLQNLLPFGFMSPVVKILLDFASLALVWLFFAGSYMLIPNTKVKFTNALIAGIMAGTSYAVLQWLFVTGQVYVTRYNAIYGSFSFLPLLLIWLQLVWTITLAGAVLCFSSQNIFEFSFTNEIARISNNYKWRLTLAVMTIAVNRFIRAKIPLTPHQIAVEYGLPITLVSESVHKLISCGLLIRVVTKSGDDEFAVSPAVEPSKITVGLVMEKVGADGSANFIPKFNKRFKSLSEAVTALRAKCLEHAGEILLSSLEIDELTDQANGDGTKFNGQISPTNK